MLPEDYRRCRYLFLANGSPVVQMKVLEQVPEPALVVADTMDLWIHIERDALLDLLKRLDGLVLNDSEARLLTGDENLVRAGRAVQRMGPKFVVIKKGEHGAMFFSEDETYVLPAYPTPRGRRSDRRRRQLCRRHDGLPGRARPLRRRRRSKRRMAYGTVVASFTVEDFSLDRLKQIDRPDIDARLAEYRQMLSF